jgi:hypothetical protein
MNLGPWAGADPSNRLMSFVNAVNVAAFCMGGPEYISSTNRLHSVRFNLVIAGVYLLIQRVSSKHNHDRVYNKTLVSVTGKTPDLGLVLILRIV